MELRGVVKVYCGLGAEVRALDGIDMLGAARRVPGANGQDPEAARPPW